MIYDYKKLTPREVFPGFTGRFIHTDRMTFAYWEIKHGASLPAHQHPHEQVVNVLEGKFELTYGGKTVEATPGMIITIPSGVEHSGRALTACTILDTFSPVREDYK